MERCGRWKAALFFRGTSHSESVGDAFELDAAECLHCEGGVVGECQDALEYAWSAGMMARRRLGLDSSTRAAKRAIQFGSRIAKLYRATAGSVQFVAPHATGAGADVEVEEE